MSLSNFINRLRKIMRNDAGISGDAQRIEQLSWMLFLKIYDEKERDWELMEEGYRSIIPEECRWRSWGHDDQSGSALTGDDFLDFVDHKLFPTLRSLEITPDTPMRQAIVRTTFGDTKQYMKDGVLLRQVCSVIDELDLSDARESHAFGEIYETILRELQSAGTAGEFYTPRALTDLMAHLIHPRVGERMADFACGTGGFITSWLNELRKSVTTVEDEAAYQGSIYGVEKKQFPFMLCVTNLLLHDIESPAVYHDNSLTKDVLNFTDDDKFDVILMNPPYGGNEKASIKEHFPDNLSSSETADLFMILIMYRLRVGGRAAVILPDGLLFGVEESQYAIKERLVREFNLHTIIRIPKTVFNPYTGIATNILFFDHTRAEGAPEGFSTAGTWFYRLDLPEGYKGFSKTKPITAEHTEEVLRWWDDRQEIIPEEGRDEKSRYFTLQELLDDRLNLDRCKYPSSQEEVLPPRELLERYFTQRRELDREIDKSLSDIAELLGMSLADIEEEKL